MCNYLVDLSLKELIYELEVAPEESAALANFLDYSNYSLCDLILLICLHSEPETNMNELEYNVLTGTGH